MVRGSIGQFGSGASTPLQDWFLSEAAVCPALLRRSGRLQEAAQNVAPESAGCGCLAGGDCQDGAELGARGKPHSLCGIQAAAHPAGLRTARQGVARVDSKGRQVERSQRSPIRRTEPDLSGTGVQHGSPMASGVCPFLPEKPPFCGASVPRCGEGSRGQTDEAKTSSDRVREGTARRFRQRSSEAAPRALPPLVTRGETKTGANHGGNPIRARDSAILGACAMHSFCVCNVCAVHE